VQKVALLGVVNGLRWERWCGYESSCCSFEEFRKVAGSDLRQALLHLALRNRDLGPAHPVLPPNEVCVRAGNKKNHVEWPNLDDGEPTLIGLFLTW
jgi:hypothetical protein